MTRWLSVVAVLFVLAAASDSALCKVEPEPAAPTSEAAPAPEATPAPETPAPETPDLADLEETLFAPPEPQPAICCICCDGCDERYGMCSGVCWNQPDPVACENACLVEQASCYGRCPYSCP